MAVKPTGLGGGGCPPTQPVCPPGTTHPLCARSLGLRRVQAHAGSGTGPLTVQTAYNGRGYPRTLKRASDGYHYVTVQAMDAFGHATVLQEGNGVTLTRGFDQATGLALSTVAGNNLLNTTVAHLTTSWDGFGNLATREDAINASTQTASYDDLNRLTGTVLHSSAIAGGTLTRHYVYDATGNRTQACKNATCTHYGYGESSAGPHALTPCVST